MKKFVSICLLALTAIISSCDKKIQTEPIPTPNSSISVDPKTPDNIQWDKISTDDYLLSSDGSTLITWYNLGTKHLDMNSDENLKKVRIIGESAFSELENLTSINISNSVVKIEALAFSESRSLKNVNIPNSVTSIENYTFYECRSLRNINIPSSVTSIGNNVFGKCINLRNIDIPSSVTSIGTGVFRSCLGLKSITIRAKQLIHNNNGYDLRENILNENLSLQYIYVPAELVEDYKKAEGWSKFADKIKAIKD